MKTNTFLFCAIALWGMACTAQKEAESAGEPVTMADPTIVLIDSTYYMYGTGHPLGIAVLESQDLRTWHVPDGAIDSLAVKKDRQTYGTQGFWAPQVLQHDGKYYMYYTANENIAMAKAEGPLGPFTQDSIGKIEAPTLQIDPFVFVDDDGSKYLYHVRLHEGNSIWVAPLDDSMSEIDQSAFTQCITATEPWEDTQSYRCDVPIIEGPTVIRRGNWYYLFYSANHFMSKDYAMGYAVSQSPLGPWMKPEGNPLLCQANIGQPGTGHGDLFVDKSGKLKYVFHVHQSDTEVSPRRTGIVDVVFSAPSDSGQPERISIDPSTAFFPTLN